MISGVKGWLGHAAVHVLTEQRGVSSQDIIGIGRITEQVLIGDKNSIRVVTWNEAEEFTGEVTFLHFAFSTRDKIESLGYDEFVNRNREIIRSASRFITLVKPRRVILASSGAVYDNADTQELTTDIVENPYGVLKLEEEVELSQAAKSVAATCVITRLWSLSGQDLQNSQPFALADFILSARKTKQIVIHSDFRVFRRYVDARELMLLMLIIAEADASITFDSGGPLVEIRKLAKEVARQFPEEIEIHEAILNELKVEDRYYSRLNTYEELCQKYLGIKPLALNRQVKNTIDGLLC
ncbi:MAG: NAD(P)-dependent oxidoreductase [Actinobacteria bacterium]|nr:NAD(P)-dependent oxidoreductase [Actinomycetota bacterium]